MLHYAKVKNHARLMLLGAYAPLIEIRRVHAPTLEAAVMAPVTRAAIIADLKCFLAWCTV